MRILRLLAKRRTVHQTARMPLLDGIEGGSFEGGCAVTARGAGSAASLSAACSELEYEQLLLAEAEGQGENDFKIPLARRTLKATLAEVMDEHA